MPEARKSQEISNPVESSHPDFEGIQALLTQGSTYKPLAERLEGERDVSSGLKFLTDRRCNLCHITEYPYSQGELVTYRDENFFIVEPVRKKSHSAREMAVLNTEHRFPSNEELGEYSEKLLRRLKNKIDMQTPEEAYTVIYSGMNSQDQPHLIGSDLRPESFDKSGLGDINNFLLYSPGDDAANPSYTEFNDIIGEAFLQRVYDKSRGD